MTTPALDGLGIHETLYGRLSRRNSLKNLLIAGCVFIMAYEGIALSFFASRTRYIPYMLVQHDDGSYQVVGTPDPHWSPTDGMAVTDVKTLVYAMRGVLMDPTENTRRWHVVLQRTTEQGSHHAEAAYWEMKEKLKTFRGMIQIDIQSVLAREPLRTYEVVWSEQRFDEQKSKVAGPEGFTRWRGVFTVKFDPAFANPNTAPDGVLYDAWVISQEN